MGEVIAAAADALKKSANLSDLTNKSSARSALELGTAATRDAGTGAGQLMPVGSFGIGGASVSVPAGYNLPLHIKNNPGLMFSGGAANEYTNAIASFGGEWFDVITFNHGSDFLSMMALSQSGKIATGSYSNGVFSGWKATEDSGVFSFIGEPIYYPSASVPIRYIKCNGSAFDKSRYPRLATLYPTGASPDLRGEFLRGWDDGRGVDPGRVLTSNQAMGIESHNHRSTAGGGGQGGSNWTYPNPQGGASFTNQQINENTGGSETRPRNVAFHIIMRAE
ncbi:tail fiber protein [Yersinia ruckeri]|nr:tail fiber protein [Yersinia ruckeri]